MLYSLFKKLKGKRVTRHKGIFLVVDSITNILVNKIVKEAIESITLGALIVLLNL